MEELFQGVKKLEIGQISLIAADESNIRAVPPNSKELLSMTESVAQHGIVTPIMVRQLTAEEYSAAQDLDKEKFSADDCYGITDGHTRFAIAKKMFPDKRDVLLKHYSEADREQADQAMDKVLF